MKFLQLAAHLFAGGPHPRAHGRNSTQTGLEVEGIARAEAVPGGLKGLVIGEVKKGQHPNADRLSVTRVDVVETLHIVCGAPNVDQGQKVVVATVEACSTPPAANRSKSKKARSAAKCRGMICAEDEIGLGTGHDGIMVLDPAAEVGTPAAACLSWKTTSPLKSDLPLTAPTACRTSAWRAT